MQGSVVVIAIGRVLQILVSLLAVRVLTTLLSPAEVGNYYLINSLVALFGFALLNPVGMYFYRKLNIWVVEGCFWNRFVLYVIYIAAVAGLSSGIVFILRSFFHIGSGVDVTLLLLYVLAYIFFNTFNQNSIALLNFLERRTDFVLLSLATSLGGLVLAVFLVKKSSTALFWLAGQLGAQAIFAFVAVICLAKVVSFKTDNLPPPSVVTAENCTRVFRFVLPLAFTTLLTWSQTQSYRLIVEQRVGLEFLGQIGLGFSIAANISAAVESIVHQIYMPVFYREISTPDPDVRTAVCNRLIQMTIPLYLGLSIFVSCLAPFLVSILAHGKFSGAYLYVIFGAWIEFFRMITGILSTAAHSEMKTGYLVKAYFIGGVLAIVGVVSATQGSRYDVLIPLALVISGMVSMVVMYRQMHKIIRVKVGIRDIVQAGFLSLPFVGALIFQHQRESIIVSILVTGIFGSYLLASQYWMFKRFNKMSESLLERTSST